MDAVAFQALDLFSARLSSAMAAMERISDLVLLCSSLKTIEHLLCPLGATVEFGHGPHPSIELSRYRAVEHLTLAKFLKFL